MLSQQTLALTGAPNTRELGGYVTRSGQRVRTHALLRADNLAELSLADQRKLVAYGVTVVVDTRSHAEWVTAPDKVPQSIQVCHVPIFNNDETESTQTIQRLNRYYADDPRNGYRRMLRVYRRLVLSEQPRQAYKRFFELLATRGAGTTILYHCTSGKDRTGMCTLLLLGVLGVPIAQIKQDYLASNLVCLPTVVRRIHEARRHHMNQNFQSSILDLSTVSGDYFDQALTLIDGEFGGIKAYLVDYIGLSEAVIHQLQRRYLTTDLA